MTKKFVMLLALLLATLPGFAQVPTQALTFDTNLSIFKSTVSQTDKIRDAEELIKRVIATEEFRNEVLNHTYNGAKTYKDNGGYSNSQIYQMILDGAEKLQSAKNNTMDMEVEFYYEYSSTVGYTYSNSKRIWVNSKFYNGYTPAQCTGNLMHEWLHKLGFTHAVSYSVSRDYSVPYAIGRIMSKLAASNLTSITAPGNVTLSSTSSGVTLNWSAASASAGIKEYKIYYRPDGSSTNTLQGTTTSLSFSQSTPSSSGYYYVRSVDKNGATAKSAEIRYEKFFLNPVTNLTLAQSSSSVTLKWSASQSSAGVKEYKVYRKLEGSSTAYLQGTTTTLTYTQSAPSSNATYYIQTVDIDGKTVNSDQVSYKKAILTAPTNLTLTKGTTTLTLKWTAATSPKGIKEYKIYRRLYGSSTNYLQGTTTSLSWSQTKPSSSATYYVRAVENVTGTTAKSSEVTYTK